MNHHAKPYRNSFFAGLLVASAMALSACSGAAPDAPPEEAPLKGATIGGEFELVNSDGETVRWSDFDGQYRTVYFGYTYCPDFCPNDMSQLARGLKKLAANNPDKVAKVTPIFISIDPERDTPDAMGQFASAFSDDMIGLTGTPEQVKVAADAFRIPYSRGRDLGKGQYLMDHPTYTMLFGPDGKPIAMIPTDLGPDAVAAEIDKWVS